MQHESSGRRILLGGAGAAALSALLLVVLATIFARAAHALDAPSGKVILTVTGRLQVTNDARADTSADHSADRRADGKAARASASFDLAQLQALPVTRIMTKTPWHGQPRSYTGVLLRDLLAAVGTPTADVHAVALNDYEVDIPIEDVFRGGAMVAYLIDDKPMTVREKGPLMVMYPFDDRPELRNAVHYSRAIWQLRTLELK